MAKPKSSGSGGEGKNPQQAPTHDDLTVALALLTRARELVTERSGWTQRAWARDRHSHQVEVTSPRAVRFCVAGAAMRAAHEILGAAFPSGQAVSVAELLPLQLVFAELAETLADWVREAGRPVRRSRGFYVVGEGDKAQPLDSFELIVRANDCKPTKHDTILFLVLQTELRLREQLASSAHGGKERAGKKGSQ